MELQFEKYCVVDGSPTTVLPSPRRYSKNIGRKSERKPISENDHLLKQNTNLKDITFCIYKSTSSNTTLYSGNNDMLKRGSVYQSSQELSETNTIEFIDELELLEPNTPHGKHRIQTCSSDLLDISFLPVSGCESVISTDGFVEILLGDAFGPSNDGNEHREDDSTITNTPYDRLDQPHYSSCRSQSDWSESSTFLKCKSLTSPLGSDSQHDITKTVQKSPLGNFSSTWSSHCDSQLNTSPAHLHGILKWGHKRGVPFFEFSVKQTKEILVAKMWKTENALNWVYTFHKKQSSNSTGWGFNDNSKESSSYPIARMQVSCYLYTEPNRDGGFDNSMVTEFVLYNTEQARKNGVTQDNPQRNANEWEHIELNPTLEIAAVVIKVPLEKRKSLKCKRRDENMNEPISMLHDIYNMYKRNKENSVCTNTASVNVITPWGSHGLPESESSGPLPLLDRWMYGGGCDCGGWDMGCPLVVSGNTNIQYGQEHLVADNQHPLELFLQGTKEKTPALAILVTKEGQYAVDFHAQFSTLQAFSICVAILHSMKNTSTIEH